MARAAVGLIGAVTDPRDLEAAKPDDTANDLMPRDS